MNQAHARAFADRDTTIDRALAERVLAAIDPDETIAFLQALVRVPSVNPPGDVREAIRLCAEKLAGEGFATQVVGAEPAKTNLVATLRGREGGPRLAFNAHVDVVPIGEESAWRHAPFGAELVDGRVYGRGAGDDKASVAAQVMAGVALARAGAPLDGALIVTTVADEETGGALGAGYIVQEGHVGADFAIVGEQTQGQICVGERGAAGVGVTVYGATGHAATPWKGVNAIEGMARVITALREELWPVLEARTHRYFPHSTATISVIEGGVKTNVIPDRCSIHIDRRILPGEEPDEVAAEIRQVAERAIAGVGGLRAETVLKAGRTAIESDPQSPVGRAMQEATRYLGKEVVLTGFFAATDGKHFAARGWPTLIMGPGDPATAHTPDEWVGVDEVLEATKLYALAALALLATKS
jgi:succinyl-diaminopimelate desuccinylase